MGFQIDLDKHLQARRKKHLALYYAIRERITAGISGSGEYLPSSRDLAAEYGLARGTVTQAYEMLSGDGYIQASGRQRPVVAFDREDSGTTSRVNLRLSEWGVRLESMSRNRRTDLSSQSGLPDGGMHLYPGFSDPRIFPGKDWNRAVMRAVRNRVDLPLAPGGHLQLRERLAAHLRYHRNIQATADNTLILNGSMQAIALLCHLLLGPGDAALMEDPGFSGIRNAIMAVGATPRRIPVDNEGLDTGLLAKESSKARLAFVTPTHQFPTGVVLSMNRRRALIQWAEQADAIVVEDDYDSEFRRRVRSVEPLRALDPDRVVYMGTFSRTISVALRLGYVVLPEALVRPFLMARQIFETYSPGWMEQNALSEFMGSGHYERHLRRMTRLYRQRHDAMREAFDRYLPGLFVFSDSDAGLHLFGIWQGKSSLFRSFMQECHRGGIHFGEGRDCYERKAPDSAIFSFSHIDPDEIDKLIQRMGLLWRRISRASRQS